MILLEQYIELKVYHFNTLKKFNVLEIGNDDEGLCFIVLYRGYYVFTMVPKQDGLQRFELSKFDKEQHMPIDWDLYSKIEVSLYSVFLKKTAFMQVKIFTIPIPGGEALTEDMNVFLRAKKVLEVTDHLVSTKRSAHWCFCIKYLDDVTASDLRPRVDYRTQLDEASFQRFSRMRVLRKQLAKDEGIPAYAIFSDEELSELAKIEILTPASMRSVKGVGEKKVEKYGTIFTDPPIENEKG